MNFIFQVIFLDDSPQNLKAAKEMGMATILVKNPFTALKELQTITGIDVSLTNSCSCDHSLSC